MIDLLSVSFCPVGKHITHTGFTICDERLQNLSTHDHTKILSRFIGCYYTILLIVKMLLKNKDITTIL